MQKLKILIMNVEPWNPETEWRTSDPDSECRTNGIWWWMKNLEILILIAEPRDLDTECRTLGSWYRMQNQGILIQNAEPQIRIQNAEPRDSVLPSLYTPVLFWINGLVSYGSNEPGKKPLKISFVHQGMNYLKLSS